MNNETSQLEEINYKINVTPSLKEEKHITLLCNRLSSLVITDDTESIINEFKNKYACYIKLSKPIPYDQLTNFIFNNSDKISGNFLSNLTFLIEYVDKRNNIQEKEFLFFLNKLLVHYNLAVVQRQFINDNIQKINLAEIKKNLKQLEKNFNEKNKKIENKFNRTINTTLRNHITILGIFTSIVATFFGLSTFSAAIFKNIMDTNFFKLIVISSLIGLFFYGTIHLFVSFIAKITNIEVKYNHHIVPILLFSLVLLFTFFAYSGAIDAFSNCLNL